MIVQIQYCVDGTGDVIREARTKFVPSETRLHIVYFSDRVKEVF